MDTEEINQGLKDFFDSLGPDDIYKRIFLEVFLEEIVQADLSQWDN